MKFSIKDFFSKCEQIRRKPFTFTKEVLNGKLHFLCSEHLLMHLLEINNTYLYRSKILLKNSGLFPAIILVLTLSNHLINCHRFRFIFYIRRISFCNFFFAVLRFIKIFSLTKFVISHF